MAKSTQPNPAPSTTVAANENSLTAALKANWQIVVVVAAFVLNYYLLKNDFKHLADDVKEMKQELRASIEKNHASIEKNRVAIDKNKDAISDLRVEVARISSFAKPKQVSYTSYGSRHSLNAKNLQIGDDDKKLTFLVESTDTGPPLDVTLSVSPSVWNLDPFVGIAAKYIDDGKKIQVVVAGEKSLKNLRKFIEEDGGEILVALHPNFSLPSVAPRVLPKGGKQ